MRHKLLTLSTAFFLLAGTPVLVNAQETAQETSEGQETSIVTIPAQTYPEQRIILESGSRRSGFDDATINALVAPYRNLSKDASQAIGFFLDMNSPEAAAIVADGVNRGIVNLNDPNDTANLNNMMEAINYIETCNALRAQCGLGTLNVDPVLMAISIVQTDASKGMYGHSNLYRVSENLAWGGQIGMPMGQNYFGNPFDYWFTEESQRPYDNGHFLNITRPNFALTGFAVGNNGVLIPGATAVFGQVFDYANTASGTIYSPQEFRNLLQSYRSGHQSGAVTPTPDMSEPIVEGAEAVYRLYNPNSGEHFYTTDQNERNNLRSLGWGYEGIGWFAPTEGGEPVYRLYNPYSGDHHYTMDSNERNILIDAGWQNEGSGWNSDPARRVALYREYNPNAWTGSHNYTTSAEEHSALVNQFGWIDEGESWYAVEKGK